MLVKNIIFNSGTTTTPECITYESSEKLGRTFIAARRATTNSFQDMGGSVPIESYIELNRKLSSSEIETIRPIVKKLTEEINLAESYVSQAKVKSYNAINDIALDLKKLAKITTTLKTYFRNNEIALNNILVKIESIETSMEAANMGCSGRSYGEEV